MKDLQEILGEELYKQVIEKAGEDVKINITSYKDGDKTINSFMPMTRFNESRDEIKILKEKVVSYEKQISDTSKLLKDSEEFKTQYSELQEKYKSDLATKDKEISNILKKSLVKENLTKAGAKHVDLLMREINLDSLNVKDGSLEGIDEVVKGLKGSYNDLFTTTVVEGNGKTNDKPLQTDPSKINWEERFKSI